MALTNYLLSSACEFGVWRVARTWCMADMKPVSTCELPLIKCTICDVRFGMEAKLQRHLLKVHVVGVSVALPVEGTAVSQEQRRAHMGAAAAIEAANKAMQTNGACPHCLPSKKGKPFSNALDLATHIIAKHFPGEESLSDDEEGKDEGVSLGAAHAPHRATGVGPIASEISERLPRGSGKRASLNLNVGNAEARAKRTKLLCVDVSKPTAEVPLSVTLPDPPTARRPQPKLEPCMLEPKSSASAVSGKESRANGSGSMPPGALPVDPEPAPTAPKRPACAEVEPPSVARTRQQSRTPPTAMKPPPTPKPPTVAGSSEKKAGPSPVGSGSSLPAVSAVSAGAVIAPKDALASAASPMFGLPPGPLGELPERVVTRGFDFDFFADVSDFPSSVVKAYYRAAPSEAVATGCPSHR